LLLFVIYIFKSTPCPAPCLRFIQSSETLYDQFKQLNSVIETENLPLNALKAQIGSMIAQDFANDANSLAGVLSFFQKKLGLKGEISFLQQLAKGAYLIHQEES
jgi:hypothetical protein